MGESSSETLEQPAGVGGIHGDRAQRFGNAQGKPQFSLILEFPDALQGLAGVLQEGCEKYSRGDWQKGMPCEEIVDSLMRHLVAWQNGEIFDPDSPGKLSQHVDKILSNALILAQLHRGGYGVGRMNSKILSYGNSDMPAKTGTVNQTP